MNHFATSTRFSLIFSNNLSSRRPLLSLLWLLLLFGGEAHGGELCPPLFGEFECPLDYKCVLGVCKNDAEQSPPQNCNEIECGPDARCVLGRCVPVEGTPCGRNVLVGEKTAHAIVSDCGRRGKCVSGKCVIDKCMEVLCEDGTFCRDGKCQKFLGNFCFSDYDCGPLSAPGASTTLLQCRANKCELRKGLDALLQTMGGGVGVGSGVAMRCDPGESPQNEKCVPQDGCAQLVCELGETCLNGFCIATTMECGGESDALGPCPEQMVCKERVCVRDPCLDRCPAEHACINDGECRLLQGLVCVDECPPSFECVNGFCVKDECRRKVCQIGERCEGGFCVRVDGRACRSKERDCGDAFECVDGACRDKIVLRTLDNFVELSTAKAQLRRIRTRVR